MLTRHIALVPDTTEVGIDDLHRVSSALSIQVARDFGPIWGVTATVDPFTDESKVPPGYWKLLIVTSDTPGDAGFHSAADNQPAALVRYSDDWSLRASHEVLEMLADPFGNNLHPGAALDSSGRTVEYLVEVCDPCEKVSYSINGVNVADFYTPSYFDAVASTSTRYDFTGAIKQPLQVLAGGYLSWKDSASNAWFQLQFLGDAAEVVTVDMEIFDGRPLRECIDRSIAAQRTATSRKRRKRRVMTASLGSR